MRIAALQMQAKAGGVAANLRRIAEAATEAAEAGARILVTPELALPGYGAGEAMRELAEPADGPSIAELQDISKRTGVAVIAGFAERAGDTVYNSAVFVDPAGRLVVYRKSHLYGPYEKALFEAERPTATVIDFEGAKIGLLICYDVEFPENVRRLAQAGVDACLVPTALPASDHAEFIARSLIPVRAFENQVFVAYVNHCGKDDRFAYAGLSGIAAPDGSLVGAAGAQGEALLIADLTRQDYAQSLAENTYLADLRLP